jgi:hypothetical protein
VGGGGGVCPSGSDTGGVLTVTDGRLGVETLMGVLGTVTVIGETDGVVTVTPGRSVVSADTVAGAIAAKASPTIPATANRRLNNLAPLSKWLPIRRLSALA